MTHSKADAFLAEPRVDDEVAASRSALQKPTIMSERAQEGDEDDERDRVEILDHVVGHVASV